MLILTRRVGETLTIGDEVKVTVLGVKGNQVRIGVDAPRDVTVHREEIYDRIKKEKEQRMYAIKAKLLAIKLLNKSVFEYKYLINDILVYILPQFIVDFIRKIK